MQGVNLLRRIEELQNIYFEHLDTKEAHSIKELRGITLLSEPIFTEFNFLYGYIIVYRHSKGYGTIVMSVKNSSIVLSVGKLREEYINECI